MGQTLQKRKKRKIWSDSAQLQRWRAVEDRATVTRHLNEIGYDKYSIGGGAHKTSPSRSVPLFSQQKGNFSRKTWRVTKHRFSTAIDDTQVNVWTAKKLRSVSQSRNCSKERSRGLLDGFQPIWSNTAFWIRVKPSQRRSTVRILTKCTKSCIEFNRHWSTEKAPRQFRTYVSLMTKKLIALDVKLSNLGDLFLQTRYFPPR